MKNQLRSEGFVMVWGLFYDPQLTCLHGTDYTILVGDLCLIEDNIHTYELDVVYRQIDCHNVFLEKSNLLQYPARIEYGAIIREQVAIKEDAVILMGSIINKGASIGKRTMIDMNAVVGSGAIIGNDVHVGAGAVIAGMMEPCLLYTSCLLLI